MSTIRTPKVSERVAPKPADPQPEKKKRGEDDDGPDFRTLLNAWLESHRASMADSLRRLGKQPIGSFFTCLVMAVALSMPMGLSLLLKNIEQLGGSWQRAAQISLYLKLDAGSRDGEALRDEIKGMPGVADAQFVSREQALDIFTFAKLPSSSMGMHPWKSRLPLYTLYMLPLLSSSPTWFLSFSQ